jgi:anti-sigma factor (TIGR02949 family)
MNRIQFGEGACEKTRKYLDSYISNELLVETNHEVLRHLESCPSCAAEADARTQLRSRLKSAVNAEPAPPELQVLVRDKIRNTRSNSWFAATWIPWAAATAAAVVLSVGLWVNHRAGNLPALTDRSAQNTYIQKVSATIAGVFRLGLGDHLHCSIFRKYPKNPPAPEKMEADLGPNYKGLLPVVHRAVPEGYRVIMAHQCSYLGRPYVHLTFEKDGALLSLVVAHKKDGESLGGTSQSASPSGVPIYQVAAQSYQVAGFEAGEFLAYVVSDQHAATNLELASTLAPGVRAFLIKAAG